MREIWWGRGGWKRHLRDPFRVGDGEALETRGWGNPGLGYGIPLGFGGGEGEGVVGMGLGCTFRWDSERALEWGLGEGGTGMESLWDSEGGKCDAGLKPERLLDRKPRVASTRGPGMLHRSNSEGVE